MLDVKSYDISGFEYSRGFPVGFAGEFLRGLICGGSFAGVFCGCTFAGVRLRRYVCGGIRKAKVIAQM